jgi:predicted nucleic acid-binding protein
MQPALFDTSVYISALRRGNDALIAIRRLTADAPLWLSSVVLEELYAGAGERERRVIERLERDFDRAKRVLIPNLTDWSHTGKLLALVAAKYGYEQIGQGRLTNDGLIATSSGRMGIRVLTATQGDYRRLSEFRAFQWQVTSL